MYKEEKEVYAEVQRHLPLYLQLISSKESPLDLRLDVIALITVTFHHANKVSCFSSSPSAVPRKEIGVDATLAGSHGEQ